MIFRVKNYSAIKKNERMKYITFLYMWIFSLLCINCFDVMGQNLIIKSVSLQPLDKTALNHPFLDNNGDTCALLKIKTDNLEGIEFSNPNQFIKVSYANGVYSVYLPELSRKLDFQHKDYMPVQLDMADYGYRRLRKGKTYLAILDAPRKTDLKSTVVLKVDPKTAVVTFDNRLLEPSENGTYEIPVAAGSYSYLVKAENYQPWEGSVSIGKSEAKTVPLRLLPITHVVFVDCNVSSARVFVDNLDYGSIGKMMISQGDHIIRVQAEGYVDVEKKVSVNATTGPLSFILKENKRTTHIHATPVTIYSSSSSIYKNNKRIKEWSNGATIMFMPGKYLLSDYEGNTLTIVVGSEPMTINL